MSDSASQMRRSRLGEYRFVLIGSFVALAITSIPYVLGAAMGTDERVFGGFVYAVEDGYSYLAKMRRGAEGAWLFHIAYTPEAHPGALFFPFHLLLGKIASLLPGSDLTLKMVWTYHVARWIFGFGLLLTVYRFLAAFTKRVIVRRLAWIIATFGGGLGWLLIAVGRSSWLGSMPLDFILPEGFTFLVLYAFPHIAMGRTLLLWGLVFLFRTWHLNEQGDAPHSDSHSASSALTMKWAVLTGLLWLLMGLMVPFYVAVAWAVAGASWLLLALRERRIPWRGATVAGIAALVSAPIVVYSAWRFTSHPVYEAWASQNRILSPHPIHYVMAYGVPLALAAFAVKKVWRSDGPMWLMLAWVGVVPLLVYLPFNLQRRLVEGVQIPLSLLAATGLTEVVDLRYGILSLSGFRSVQFGWREGGSRRGSGNPLGASEKQGVGKSLGSIQTWRAGNRVGGILDRSSLRSALVVGIVLLLLLPSNIMLTAGNTMTLRGRPSPIFRDVAEVVALDWLSRRVQPDDVVLASYETGNYLPARVGARAFVGHGPESVRADEKRTLVAQFFDAAANETWREQLLSEYGVDYVLWGPRERDLGEFDPGTAGHLQPIYEERGYHLFEVIG